MRKACWEREISFVRRALPAWCASRAPLCRTRKHGCGRHVAGQRKAEHRVNLSGFEALEGDRPGTQMDMEAIGGDDDEALFKKALITVAETQKASTSFLQRRLRIGYNRAALLIEELEDRMHIGPQNGSTPAVFITPEEIEWAK